MFLIDVWNCVRIHEYVWNCTALYTPWISSWVIWLEIAEHARVASQRLCISKLQVGPAKRGLDEVWVLSK